MLFSPVFSLSLSDCFVGCEQGWGSEEGEEHGCHVEDILSCYRLGIEMLT
jgi:hypothetical protein